MKHLKFYRFLMLALLALSCESTDPELSSDPTAQIQEARNWFQTNYLNFGFDKTVAPVWSKAMYSGSVVEVAFTVDEKLPAPRARGLSMKFAGRQRLQIKKEGNDFGLEIVSYIPSNKNKVNISGVNMKTWREGFHGKIIYENINNGSIHFQYVSDGQIVSRSHIEKYSSGAQYRSKGDCDWEVVTAWYRFTGQEWEFHDNTYAYYAAQCPVIGSGEGYDPGDWGENGGGGGGGSGGDTGGAGPYDCIEINITNECLNNVAHHVLNPNLVSTYNALIQDVFGASQSVNLLIIDGPLPNNVIGHTSDAIETDDAINVSVTIDPVKFIGASKEYVASTIYHECFHALSNAVSDNYYSANHDHVAMFSSYLNLLADGLRAAYPNLSEDDSKDLILKGILGINSWSSEFVDAVLAQSGSSRERVQDTSSEYRNSSSGTACN